MRQELESALHRVKLYHRGATIYRSATLKLDKAAASQRVELELPGLPLALLDATVRLSCKNAPDAAIITDLRVGLHVKPSDAPLESIDEQELKRLKREHQQRSNERDALIQQQQLFESIRLPLRPAPLPGQPPVASPMKARVALEQRTHEAIQARQERLRKLRAELQALDRQIAQRQDALSRASIAKQARADQVSKTVMALLELGEALPEALELELEYFVDGARWAPQYQCRIARDGSSASIIMRALVSQASGEDWSGVKLELSTAAPMSWTSLPKLNAIRIGKAQTPAPTSRGFRPPPVGAQSMFTDLDRDWALAKQAKPQPQHWSPPALPAAPQARVSLLDCLLYAQEEANQHNHYAIGGAASPPECEEYADDDDYGSYDEAPRMRAAAGSAGFGAPPPPMAAPAPAMPPGAPPAKPQPSRKRSAAPNLAYKMELQEDVQFAEMREELSSLDALTQGGALQGGAHFAMLTLSAPTAQTRGQLQPTPAIDRYHQSLMRSGLTPSFNIDMLVQEHQQRASQAVYTPMPQGAYDVRQLSGQFDYVYLTRDAVDVPSDASFHSVPVDEQRASCELHYVVVPRNDNQVYRIAALENPTKAPLLRGLAELYVGDEYILTTELPTVAPRERFKLGLGVEQAIKCARNTTFEERRSGQAVVATSELWHTIEIELLNRLGAPVSCEVRERIPHPAKDAEVVIEEAHVSPPWRSYDQRERGKLIHGGRSWQLTLEPNKPTVLKAQYIVKIYANNEVVGGNRREQ